MVPYLCWRYSFVHSANGVLVESNNVRTAEGAFFRKGTLRAPAQNSPCTLKVCQLRPIPRAFNRPAMFDVLDRPNSDEGAVVVARRQIVSGRRK